MPIVVNQDFVHHITGDVQPQHKYGPYWVYADAALPSMPANMPRVVIGPIKVPAVLALAEREYGRLPDGELYVPPVNPQPLPEPEEPTP